MARDLTDLSQLESGAFQMKKDRIGLKPWLEDIASRFKRITSEHEVVFEYWIEEDTLEIWADRQRLSQAVFNLLTNAHRHTPEKGKIRLEIGSEKDQVLIRVWNQGSRIAIEELNEVWKGFYRGKKEEERGMGLGLAIVDQIVKAHHGNRSVENRENGVLFTLKFPK